MKLTLGQAAKEVGISKPSLSAAIKKGRLSAHKSEKGHYEIDPAELFRVYPPRGKANKEANGVVLSPANPRKSADSEGLGLLLAEKDKLLEEKERSIARLEDEKEQIREDLEAQREQAKRITLLLEHHTKEPEKNGEWEKALKALEARIANQEDRMSEEKAQARARLKKAKQINDQLKRELEEKSKTLWQKLFG